LHWTTHRDQNRSIGEEQLDEGIVDTFVSVGIAGRLANTEQIWTVTGYRSRFVDLARNLVAQNWSLRASRMEGGPPIWYSDLSVTVPRKFALAIVGKLNFPQKSIYPNMHEIRLTCSIRLHGLVGPHCPALLVKVLVRILVEHANTDRDHHDKFRFANELGMTVHQE
jgi:hypothetical protein